VSAPDEAGGAPNTAAQVRLAAAHEVRATPRSMRQRSSGIGAAWWLIGISILMGVAIVASVLWMAS